MTDRLKTNVQFSSASSEYIDVDVYITTSSQSEFLQRMYVLRSDPAKLIRDEIRFASRPDSEFDDGGVEACPPQVLKALEDAIPEVQRVIAAEIELESSRNPVNQPATEDKHPALKIVDEVIHDFDGAGITSVGANAALKAMSLHWADHLFEGHSPSVISEDIDEMKRRLEIMRAEIMNRCSQADLLIERHSPRQQTSGG